MLLYPGELYRLLGAFSLFPYMGNYVETGVIPMVINIFVHNRQVLALQRINMNGCQTLGFDIRLSYRSCCYIGFGFGRFDYQ